MAFVNLIEDPFRLDRVDADGVSIVSSLIGADLSKDLLYIVIVYLHPYSDKEFGFSIIARNTSTGMEVEYDRGRQTHDLFSQADRKAILGVILAATDDLLCWKQPKLFRRVTSDRNLPPAGMAKHHAVTEVMRARGYNVTEEEPSHGQRMWVVWR